MTSFAQRFALKQAAHAGRNMPLTLIVVSFRTNIIYEGPGAMDSELERQGNAFDEIIALTIPALFRIIPGYQIWVWVNGEPPQRTSSGDAFPYTLTGVTNDYVTRWTTFTATDYRGQPFLEYYPPSEFNFNPATDVPHPGEFGLGPNIRL